jgi:predicted nucleic acid-binding protein
MIILDTNVISEMMKSIPSVDVVTWMNKQNASELFITTISIAEITYGLNALPIGQRRKTLEDAFQKTMIEAFEYRVLLFDESAAQIYGRLMANRKHLGRPLSILDGQIAAIAFSNEFAVATRNLRDFSDCGLRLVNPFEGH